MRFSHERFSRLQRNYRHGLHTPEVGLLPQERAANQEVRLPQVLYINTNGKGHRISTKSTSWTKAEEMAAAERERLRAGTAPAAKHITVDEALQRWLASFKDARPPSTARVHKTYTDKISRWAAANNIELLRDVTRIQLGQWRGEWGRGPPLPNGNNRYWYDAEGRVCAVQSTSMPGVTVTTGYLYDADGNRVAKGTITSMSCDPTKNGFQFTENYVLGVGGEELTMLDGNNNWQRTNVYAAGKLIGTYDLLANPSYTQGGSQPAQVAWLHFHLGDHLGTRRMQISGMLANLGQPETDFQSLPFGDQFAPINDPNADPTADDATPLHYTGKEHDSESDNDYFEARYLANAMGRFLTPDWSAKAVPVPYARMDNPQSLNLYAYVGNNPMTAVDPDGHMSDSDFSALFMLGLEAQSAAWQQQQAANAAAEQAAQQAQQNTCSVSPVLAPFVSTFPLVVNTIMGEEAPPSVVGHSQYQSGDEVGKPTGSTITSATLDSEAYLIASSMVNRGNQRGQTLEGVVAAPTQYTAYTGGTEQITSALSSPMGRPLASRLIVLPTP
jgi:RHS repeat-associated protein